jgi:cytochrome P450
MNISPPPEQRLNPFSFYSDMRHTNPVAYYDRSQSWWNCIPRSREILYITLIAHGHSHLGFSHGIHFCLGAPLARLEASFVLKIILGRLQDIELEDSNIQSIRPLPSLFFHGVSQLPLRFKANNPKNYRFRKYNEQIYTKRSRSLLYLVAFHTQLLHVILVRTKK